MEGSLGEKSNTRKLDAVIAELQRSRSEAGGRSVAFFLCTVEDAYAHSGSYLIRFPGGVTFPATDLLHFSGLPLGARPIGMYLPKSRVLAVRIPGLEYAIILGAVPKQAADPRLVLPASLALRSCVGIVQDVMHSTPLLSKSNMFGNFSVGRPLDSLPGDWGSINDLGVAIWLGRVAAGLRASDAAKVEAFWGDDLLRLTGYNLEIFTASAEEQRVDDEGEYNEISFMSPYPWEGMGIDKLVSVTRSESGRAEAGEVYAPLEPKKDDQHIIPRDLRLRGYLGDIEHQWVCLPPENLDPETFEKVDKPYTGLSEIVRHIDGTLGFRSARQVILEKTIKIVVPKRMKSSEDPLGDTVKESYSPSGILGNKKHKKPPFVWGDETANIRSAQSIDQNIWMFDRYMVVGLDEHKKDWKLPEEEDDVRMGVGTFYDKEPSKGHEFMLPLSGFAEVLIDERLENKVKYYRTRSAIQLHEDGSVTIEDGYGSQIMLKGGSIFLSAVNDVWVQPGRSFVAWAPYDAIVRAGNCAEVTASKKDVRIKAERNLQLLSGNSGQGGCVIENRAKSISTSQDFVGVGDAVNGHGITLKAPKSSLHAFSKNIYLGVDKTQSTGLITLDAGLGEIYARAKDLVERLTGALSVIFTSDTAPDLEALAMTKQSAIISTSLAVGGNMEIVPLAKGTKGSLFVGGALAVYGPGLFDGNVASNGALAHKSKSPFVAVMKSPIKFPKLPAELAAELAKSLDSMKEPIQRLEDAMTQVPETSPGNAEFQNRVGVSMRTSEQLKIKNFKLFEARWQQWLRQRGAGVTWDEPVVKAPSGQETRPHPGQELWTGENFATVEAINYDVQTGAAKSRESLKQNGEASKTVALDSGYRINIQK